MMMGELMMQAERWVVDGLPSLIPPRVDQQTLQARLEEMLEQARVEYSDRIKQRLPGYMGDLNVDEAHGYDFALRYFREILESEEATRA